MSKNKIDIGSKMSFNNIKREKYSLQDKKDEIVEKEKIVKIDIDILEESPKEWNFYPPLTEEDFEKLVYSILENGLIHPIVVRKQDEKNIILSGHNRVKAFREIIKNIEKKEKGNTPKYHLPENIQKNDYLQIMCVLKEQITDNEAKEIIIDANYVQRKLSQKLLTKSVIEKYKIVQDRRKNNEEFKNKKTRDIVAEEFKLSGRHIDRYKKLDHLNKEILELFYNAKISLELASKIALLKEKVQNQIAKNYIKLLPKYPSKIAEKLKASLTIKDIDNIFKLELKQTDKIVISIVENGKTKNIEINDENIKKEIFDIVNRINSTK